jgi:CRP-like cAMP-binding protein
VIYVTFCYHIYTTLKVSIQKFDFQSDRILSSLSQEDRQAFLDAGEQLSFKKGKLIFYEGGIPTGVFLINTGKAKIYKTGLDGKDQIFYIYQSGDLLGYHALLCNENYEDSCEVLQTSDILFVSKLKFDDLLQKIPKLQLLLIQNMSHEFGVMVNTITVMAHKPLRERLALYLLILEERYRSDNTEIVLPREDLANIIGTARESLGRLLKEFKEDGLIEINGKAITIKQPNRLQKVASSEYN